MACAGREDRLDEARRPDAVLWAVLPLPASRRTPVQFHTGYGDPDLHPHLANPRHLRPLYDAYVDLGLAVPHASVHAMRASPQEAMHRRSRGSTPDRDRPC